MGKQRYRDRGKQGLTVKKRAGRRTFGYQVPRDVAAWLPPGATVTVVSLTKAEIDALARRVEPEVTRLPCREAREKCVGSPALDGAGDLCPLTAARSPQSSVLTTVRGYRERQPLKVIAATKW